jgi:hypothetical protein
MAENQENKGWWQTIPGMLTAVAGVISALTGFIVALHQIGVFGSDNKEQSRFEASMPQSPDQVAGKPAHSTVNTLKLRNVGIDFSVPEADLAKWLSNSDTPYPAISAALLDLLEGKRLRQPVYLDVIVWNYEHGPGASSPRIVADVNVDRLRAAVIGSYNERYGEAIRDFRALAR